MSVRSTLKQAFAFVVLATAVLIGSSAYEQRAQDADRLDAASAALSALDRIESTDKTRRAIQDARSAMVLVSEPTQTPIPWAGIAALVVLAGAMAFWDRRARSRPIANAIQSLKAFTHGDRAARANIEGGPEAREIARALNAVADHSDVLVREACDGTSSDVRALAKLIRDFGRGSLTSSVPKVSPEMTPIGEALAGAQSDLATRIVALHSEAEGTAGRVVNIGNSARLLDRAASEAVRGVKRVGEVSDRAVEQLDAQNAKLEAALVTVAANGEELRRSAKALRTDQQLWRRSLADLRQRASEASRLARDLAQLEGAISLLESLGQGAVGDLDATEATERSALRGRGALAARRARSLVQSITGSVESLAADIETLFDGIERSVTTSKGTEPDLDDEVVRTLRDSVRLLGRIAEELHEGVEMTEAGLTGIGQQIAGLRASGRSATSAGVGLGRALAEFQLSDTPAEEIVGRLQRAKQELEKAGEGGLTTNAERFVADMAQIGEGARQRLARLINRSEVLVATARASMS